MPDHSPRENTSRRTVPRPRHSPEEDGPAATAGDTHGEAPAQRRAVINAATQAAIDARVAALVEAAPPLSEEIRDRLASLFSTVHHQ